MIIVDLNQVLFATFFASVGKYTNVQIEEPLVRHMALNMLRNINKKFRNDYGDMIIAADSVNNWRKEYFPYYKASRRKAREESDVDWKSMFKCMDSIRSDLRDYFPYNYIQIEGCEADDVIGTIVEHEHANYAEGSILIVSGDKDFKQLQKWNSVSQYDPVRKRWINDPDGEDYLEEHILTGDKSDGVPNILSDDNVFVTDQRQKILTGKRRVELKGIEDRHEDKYYRNYIRNKTLIDLSCTPKELKEKILIEYEKGPNVQDRSQLLPYMMKHKMRNLIEHLSDF